MYYAANLIVGVYVDDLLVGKREEIMEFKRKLSNEIDIKDLGEASLFLSIRIRKEGKNQVTIDQEAYIDSILQDFNMMECRGVCSPLEPGSSDREENSIFNSKVYRESNRQLAISGEWDKT
jgi:hypothetical protein